MSHSGDDYKRCDLCGISKHYGETLYIKPGILAASSRRICLRCLETAIQQLKATKTGAEIVELLKKAG